MTIGERIKNRRIELGLSVDELASKLGKNRTTVYRYESGYIKDFPITIMEPLASALETTPGFLLLGDDFETKSNAEYHINMNISDREHSHILTYRELSEQGKDQVDTYADKLKRIEQQDSDSDIVEQFQRRFVARNGNKNLSPDQMKAIMEILDNQ